MSFNDFLNESNNKQIYSKLKKLMKELDKSIADLSDYEDQIYNSEKLYGAFDEFSVELNDALSELKDL